MSCQGWGYWFPTTMKSEQSISYCILGDGKIAILVVKLALKVNFLRQLSD
jgi:hypothetical protein